MGSVGATKNVPLKNITDNDILVFQGGKESGIEILKDARKYTTFRAVGNSMKYRLNKENGEVQSSPYWNVIKNMYLRKGK